jgi:hypothetical protein
LLKSLNLRLERDGIAEIGVRLSSPQPKSFCQHLRGAVRVNRYRLPSTLEILLKLHRVDMIRIDCESVGVTAPLDRVVENTPQFGYVSLQGVPSAFGWIVTPDPIDKTVGGKAMIDLGQQQGKYEPLSWATQQNGVPVDGGRQLSEDLIAHPPKGTLT